MEYLTLFKTTQPILKDLLDDTFIARFPTIAVAIFKEVDNKSLGNCRVSSKIWEKFIDEEKFPWVRRIGMHRDNLIGFSEDWRKVLVKAPYEPIKSLAFAVEKFFSSRNKKTWFQFFGLKKYSKKQHQWAPHHIAAEYGELELCKYIFQKTTLRNPATKFGTTPLHIVAAMGRTDLFQLIIEDLVEKNPGDKKQKTPLHLAAKEGHLEICKLIIDNESETHPRDFRGKTPLHYAARSGHHKVYKFIMDLSRMEDKNPGDNFGRTPLHISVKRCDKYFQKKEVSSPTITTEDFFELFKIIIENVEDKNPGDMTGWTPLHEATHRGLTEVCELISDNVLDRNPMTMNGLTPRKIGEDVAFDFCCRILFFFFPWILGGLLYSIIGTELTMSYYLEGVSTFWVAFAFPWLISDYVSKIYHSEVKTKLKIWLYVIYSIAMLFVLFMSNALHNFIYSSAIIGVIFTNNAFANATKGLNLSRKMKIPLLFLHLLFLTLFILSTPLKIQEFLHSLMKCRNLDF
jgi:ankyrin repeat protein